MDWRAKEAQRYLQGVQYALKRIEDLTSRAAQLRCLATRVTTSYGGIGGGSGGNHSRVEDAVVQIADLEADIDACARRLRENYNHARAMVDRLEDERERVVLEMRYLSWEAAPWGKVMRTLYMEKTNSFRVHKSALLHIWQMMEEEKNNGGGDQSPGGRDGQAL